MYQLIHYAICRNRRHVFYLFHNGEDFYYSFINLHKRRNYPPFDWSLRYGFVKIYTAGTLCFCVYLPPSNSSYCNHRYYTFKGQATRSKLFNHTIYQRITQLMTFCEHHYMQPIETYYV